MVLEPRSAPCVPLMGEGVSFHTFTLPENRCARLLVKNRCRGMSESVIREELESLGTHVQGVTLLRSGRRDQEPTKNRLPITHFIVSAARGPEVSRVRLITELRGLRVVRSSKGPKEMQALPALRTHAAKLRLRASVRRV